MDPRPHRRRAQGPFGALVTLCLAASAGAEPPAGWRAAVVEPLAAYARDLAEGDAQGRVWLIDADAAANVVLRGGVESSPYEGGFWVHGLSSAPVLVPYAEVRAEEPAHRAALSAAWSGPPPADGVLDWLASRSAALASAAARLEPDPARRGALAAAHWSFFGFRRGGVEDMPSIGARARAQTLRMLRALSPGAPEPTEAGRAGLRAVWERAQEAAHDTQFMLTGRQVRAAALALHPTLAAWAAARPPADGELRWGEVSDLARSELKPARPRGTLWAALDADAARTLAEAGAVLAARGWPAPAPGEAPPPEAARASPHFEDVTSSANFLGPTRDALDVVTIGAACLDYDRDGLPDLFVGEGRSRGGRLWRNLGGMRFEPVSSFVPPPVGERAAAADFDGDGWTDLLVLGDPESPTRLLRNRKGVFTDVTREAGLVFPRGLVESALWFDADQDGDLDLYLAYLGRGVDRVVPAADGANGSPNRLYLQERGRFRDATEGSGLEDSHWGWAVAGLDYDGDGREDVYLCNAWGPSRLLRSLGRGRFEDVTAAAGAGVDTLCKGVSVGDADGDGALDLFVSALSRPQELHVPLSGAPPRALLEAAVFSGGSAEKDPAGERLFLSRGSGRFEEAAGTVAARGMGMGWGGLLYDFDLDGSQDLFMANGFYPDVLFYHDEVKSLRLWDGSARAFREPPPGHGADFLGCSRGALAGDFDRDGCPDLLVTGLHGARLLRGLCPAGRRWARLTLEQPGPNRAALGAVVRARAGGRERILAWGRQGGGQLASGCGELLVGLGDAEAFDEAVVTWPGGTRESFGPFAAGTSAVLRRGAGRRVP